MIGLGSNRLSVCRRGGMSVTQAGRGGMEWLAGGRLPSWATPYSAQATAALRDAFTAAQWVTIRDYGFSHPEIVGYMNAYAPEDAKIAYSLVEGIGTRYVINNANSYATMPAYNTTQNTFIRLKSKILETTGIYPAPIQLGRPYDKQKNLWLGNATTIGYAYAGVEYLDIATFSSSTVHLFELIYNKFYVDGVLKSTASPLTFTCTEPTAPVAICTSAGTIGTRLCKQQIEFIEYGEGDGSMPSHKLIPFKRNGVMELLDLVSGNLATRVGTFTELIDSPA